MIVVIIIPIIIIIVMLIRFKNYIKIFEEQGFWILLGKFIFDLVVILFVGVVIILLYQFILILLLGLFNESLF